MHQITENDDWIDEFKPSPEVADAIKRVRAIELHIKELEMRINFFGEE